MSTKLTPTQIEYFMGQAIYEAKKAGALGEVPIGAVLVIDGQIVSRGFNLRERMQDATQHAELIAISEANRFERSWRLPEAQLFVTLEPCLMCAGLIQQTRITDVYYGAADPKGGAVDLLYHVLEDDRLNHQVNVVAGVREAECSALLKTFFKAVRQKRKAEKRARKEAENKLVK